MSGRPNLYHAENAWIPHATSRCPVSGETIVRVQFACGHISRHEHPASFWTSWAKRGLPFDIVAYQTVQGDAG